MVHLLLILFLQVKEIIKDDDTFFKALESEDFIFWFFGAFIISYLDFKEYKNNLEEEGKPFVWKTFWSENIEDTLWAYLGSFVVLIIYGITGNILILKGVINQDNSFEVYTPFIIGLLGSWAIEKLVYKYKKK
jgi:hypothetical protein